MMCLIPLSEDVSQYLHTEYQQVDVSAWVATWQQNLSAGGGEKKSTFSLRNSLADPHYNTT